MRPLAFTGIHLIWLAYSTHYVTAAPVEIEEGLRSAFASHPHAQACHDYSHHHAPILPNTPAPTIEKENPASCGSHCSHNHQTDPIVANRPVPLVQEEKISTCSSSSGCGSGHSHSHSHDHVHDNSHSHDRDLQKTPTVPIVGEKPKTKCSHGGGSHDHPHPVAGGGRPAKEDPAADHHSGGCGGGHHHHGFDWDKTLDYKFVQMVKSWYRRMIDNLKRYSQNVTQAFARMYRPKKS